MEKRKSEVRDLVEKLERGEITPKEVIKTLKERRLMEKASFGGEVASRLVWMPVHFVWVILCFLPAIAKFSGLGILTFFVELPRIEFPTIVIYLSIVLFVAAIALTVSGMYYNIKKGGCHSENETIILLKSGPYRIVRHPSSVAWSVVFVTIPILLSGKVPFTILSVIGIAAIVALYLYASVREERELDVRKWGDEYREYMREVPRWNIFKGLWNLWKRK